ncbi:hypothetical protein STEG23_027043, partial [Scotinomys teguina]
FGIVIDCACAYGVCSSNWCRCCRCLFFQLVWVVLVPVGSADVVGEGCSWGGCSSSNWWAADVVGDGWLGEDGGFHGFGQQNGYKIQWVVALV